MMTVPTNPDSSAKVFQLVGDVFRISSTLFGFAGDCVQKLAQGQQLSTTEEKHLLELKTLLSSTDIEEKGEKRKRKRQEKDPLAPKRPATAFLLYFTKNRDRIRNEHSSASNLELGSIAGKEWKEMNSSIREKYLNEAKGMKEEYLRQLEAYKKTKSTDNVELPIRPTSPAAKLAKELIIDTDYTSRVISLPSSQTSEKPTPSSPHKKSSHHHKSDEERRREKKEKKKKKKKEKKAREHEHPEKHQV
jgi:hypothetical protein